jgi:ATP/ADP translocase
MFESLSLSKVHLRFGFLIAMSSLTYLVCSTLLNGTWEQMAHLSVPSVVVKGNFFPKDWSKFLNAEMFYKKI